MWKFETLLWFTNHDLLSQTLHVSVNMTLVDLVDTKYFLYFSLIFLDDRMILYCHCIEKIKLCVIRKICFLFSDRLYFELWNYDVPKICILLSQSAFFFGDVTKKNIITVSKICTGYMTKLMILSNFIIYQGVSLLHFSFIIMYVRILRFWARSGWRIPPKLLGVYWKASCMKGEYTLIHFRPMFLLYIPRK